MSFHSTLAAHGRHPIPRDHATAPSLTHTTALPIPGERTGVAAKLGEQQFFKVALPDMAKNYNIFCWLNGSTLDPGQSVPRLRVFALFSAVVLLYILLLCTHGGIVGC